jgi:hypothetical protein
MHTVLTVTSAVLVDYLLLGVVLATSGWCAARPTLRRAATYAQQRAGCCRIATCGQLLR